MVLEFMLGLVDTFGYLGVFIGSLIGSASIFLPVPSFIFVFLAGKLLDPFFVGIASALGSAIGELTAYGIGFGILYGKSKLSKKKRAQKPDRKWTSRFNKWFKGKRGFLLIIIFAATPLPDDIIGLYCGAVKYNIKKFFVATLIGKFLLGLLLAYAGFYGLEFVANYFAQLSL